MAKVPAAPRREKSLGEKPVTAPAAPDFGDAFGLSLVKHGVGATPADDALLAVGYPHILVATTEPVHKDASDPTRVFKRYPTDSTHMPRAFVARYREALRCATKLDKLAAALTTDPPPLSAEEMAKAVGNRFVFSSAHSDFDLFLLEALGARTVAELAVAFLDDYPSPDWRGGDIDHGWGSIRALYFVLLRIPAELRASLRTRLEALYDRLLAAQAGEPVWRSLKALDVILHGRRGVERSGYRDSEGTLFYDLAHVDDDPDFVAEQALAVLRVLRPADRARFDIRLAFLGGPSVAKALRAGTGGFHSTHTAAIREQLSHLAL